MAPLIAMLGAALLVAFHQVPGDRVVLLPGPDGQAGALVVKTAAGESVLDRPYAGAAVDRRGGIESRQEEAGAVRERYAAALSAQPSRPVSYLVHFVFGTDELTPESLPVLDQVKAELARRPVPDIIVIGHTDRVGTLAANDALSVKRAEAVRAALISAGVDAARLSVAGRGEREPLVPTADEVAEPRNRRVEINVR